MKKGRLYYACILQLLFGVSSIHAGENNPVLPGLYQVEIIEDRTGKLGIKEVSSPLFNSQFQTTNGFNIGTSSPTSTYWMRFKINLNGLNDGAFFLETDYKYSIYELYIPNGIGSYIRKVSGLNFPFSEKYISHVKNLFFLKDIAKGQFYYVKVRSSFVTAIKVAILPVRDVVNSTIEDYYYYGFSLGLIFLTVLYSLILCFQTQEKAYLYYVFYVLSFFVFCLVDWGLLFEYIPLRQFHTLYYTIPFELMVIWLLLYSKAFLNLEKLLPWVNSVIKIIIIIRIALFLIGLFIDIPGVHFQLFDLLFVIVPYLSGIWLYSKGLKTARFFLFGLTIVVAALLFHTFPLSGVMLPQINFINSVLAEIIFFAFALGDRFRLIKSEKEQAQQSVITYLKEKATLKDRLNIELEERVKERTDALSKANQKLQQQAREIELMNALLKEENKVLDITIKDVSKARVTKKKVSFEEFKKIYPDDQSCFNYLKEVKWAKGYRCSKCSNDKFSDLKEGSLRRCTRCRYDESVTQGTIFHKIRFPLSKAFYMLYLLTNNKKITIDKLSEEIGISKPTCLSYRHKISNAIRNNPDRFPSWDALIFTPNSE